MKTIYEIMHGEKTAAKVDTQGHCGEVETDWFRGKEAEYKMFLRRLEYLKTGV